MMKRLSSRVCFVLLFAAAAAFGSFSVAGANLLANPGFEEGGGSFNGWFTSAPSGVAISTPANDNIFRSGSAAAKLFGISANCFGYDVSVCGQAFTPTVGKIYKFSGYSFVSAGDPIPGTDTCNKNRCIAKIAFFDSAVGGLEITVNEIVIGDGNTVPGQWHKFAISAPCPAGAQRVEALFLFLQPECDSGAVFVDDVLFLEEDPLPADPNILVNPSFDSDLSGWTTFGNVYYDAQYYAVRTAPGAAKLFSTFTPDFPSGMYQSFAASEGSTWKLDAWSMTTCQGNDAITDTNSNYVVARIVFADVDTVETGSKEVVILDNSSPLGTWTRHTVIDTAPAGTVTASAYILFISPSLEGGSMRVDDISFDGPVAAAASGPELSSDFVLHRNVPNPFNPTTRIEFELRKAGSVTLGIYDVAGRQVATLIDGRLDSGPHSVIWDGKTADGSDAAAGIYWYVLESEAGKMSGRMALIK